MKTKLADYKGYEIHWCTIQKDGEIIFVLAGTLFDTDEIIIQRGKECIDKLLEKRNNNAKS